MTWAAPRRLVAAALLLGLGACVTSGGGGTGATGTLSGDLVVRWIAENRFVYEPTAKPLTYVTSDGLTIQPKLMYTDGGSIPPIFWPIDGFSPWGYAPAYIVHDWLFDQHHCKDPGWEAISFERSADILGEVIDTLVKRGDVPSHGAARDLIVAGVRSSIARSLWDAPGRCNRPPQASTAGRAAAPGPVVIRFDLSRPAQR